MRTRTVVSMEMKIKLPTMENGSDPREKRRTTGQLSPSRCNQTRETVLSTWEMDNIGMASRTPNTQTKTGSATTPPPNPATPAMVNPTVVATTTATIFRTSSNRHLPKKAPVHRDGPGPNSLA